MAEDSNLPEKVTDKGVMPLTERELTYKLLRTQGMTAERAFERVFRDDPEWGAFFDELPSDPRKRTVEIRWAARELDQRKEMKQLQQAINTKVQDLAPLALDTMEQIMIESKSDKVRADVAIELLRQNVGSPDKRNEDAVNVQIVLGKDPNLGIIDGEVVDDRF